MPLTVVGIGASAGGLEAIAELLSALPPATGMAYIVVEHLDPKHESLLAEILAKKTAIPVSVAAQGRSCSRTRCTSFLPMPPHRACRPD